MSAFYWICVKAYTCMRICTVQYGKAIGLYNNYSIHRVLLLKPGSISVSLYFVLGCVCHAATISR